MKKPEEYQVLFDSLKQYSNEKDYLDHLTLFIKDVMYERTVFVPNSDNDSIRDDFYKKLRDKLESIYHTYKSDKSIEEDIQFAGCGHTSLAFRIGDVVFKIGKKRSSLSPKKNDFSCLIPVFYQSITPVGEKEFYEVQVTPYVNTYDISEEDVYSAYKSLRKCGYIWNDPTFDNTGRIEKDFSFEGREYHAGDLVIIDLEDLAYVGEETSDEILEEISMMSYNRKTYQFEMRYIEEKSQKMM